MQKNDFSSDVALGDRTIRIDTSLSPNASKITSQIHFTGRIAGEQTLNLTVKAGKDHIDQKLQTVHDELVADFKFWAEIAEKVRQVGHAPSCYKMGIVLFEKGLWEEAAAFLELTVSLNSEMAEAFHGLGAAHAALEQYDHAEKAFQAGLELAPGFADLIVHYAAMLAKSGDIDNALELLHDKLSRDGENAALHYYLAVVMLYQLAQNPDEDLSEHIKEIHAHFEQASRSNGALFNENTSEAGEELEAGQFEAAADLYEKAYADARIFWDATVDHQFYLKFMYGGMGKNNDFIGKYIEQLKNASSDAPDYADIRNNLGVAYLIMCRNLFLQALEEFNAALKINPDFKRAAKNLKLSENDGKGFLILLRALLK